MRHWRPPPGVPCTQAATSDRPPTKKLAALPLGSFINSTAVAGGGGGRDGRKRDGEGVALTRARMGRESGRTRRRTLTRGGVRVEQLLAAVPVPAYLALSCCGGPTCRLPRAERRRPLSAPACPRPLSISPVERGSGRTREGERGCSDFPTRARGRLHSLGRPRMCTARPCVAPHRAVVAATLVTRRRERACVTCFAAFAFAKGTSQSCGLKKSEGMRSK